VSAPASSSRWERSGWHVDRIDFFVYRNTCGRRPGVRHDVLQRRAVLSIGILGEYVGAYSTRSAKAGVPGRARQPWAIAAPMPSERTHDTVLNCSLTTSGSARHQRRIAARQFAEAHRVSCITTPALGRQASG